MPLSASNWITGYRPILFCKINKKEENKVIESLLILMFGKSHMGERW